MNTIFGRNPARNRSTLPWARRVGDDSCIHELRVSEPLLLIDVNDQSRNFPDMMHNDERSI